MAERNLLTRSALWIALVYVLFGSLWILLSDRAVEAMFRDADTIIRASMLKGWLYVGATGLLLHFLVAGLVGRLSAAHQREIDHLLEGQRTHALLVAIVDSSEDAIFAKDLQGKYLLFNAAASRFVGKPAADVLGRDDRALFPPGQAELVMATDRRVAASGRLESNEEVLTTAVGERVFLATKGPLRDADNRTFGTFGVSRDITESKQAEITLTRSERRFHDIVEASADWIWEIDAAGRYTYVSDSVRDLLGYAPEELLGKTPFDLMPPEEAARVGAEFAAVVARRAPFHDLDNVNIHKDGRLIHVSTNGIPVFAGDGTLLGYRGLDHDITERKTAQDNLQRLADDLGATLQAIPDLLFEVDAGGRYLAVKATHEALLAAPADQLLGRTVADVLPSEAAATIMAALAAASRTGTDYGRTITLPLQHGPAQFEISVARKTLVGGQGERFIVLSRDITARSTVEEQLRQRNAELERFNRATIGRELDMIEMKKTINALSRELGREPPYPLAFVNDGAEQGTP